MVACTIRMYEFSSEVPIEARMRRIFLPELATVTQTFGTLIDHDHDRLFQLRTEIISVAFVRRIRNGSLGIFFRFVQ
jgi:hypothetical protein